MFQLTAEELAGIVAVVVGFTELIKLSKVVDDKYGLVIAALMSALGIAAYVTSKPELVFNRFLIWPFVSAFLVVITAAGGVYGIIRSTRGGDVTDASGPRNPPRLPMWILAVLGGSMMLTSCAHKPPAVVVGQAGVIAVDSIHQIQLAVQALNLPTAQERKIQIALLDANTKLAPVPDLIISIDNATKAGQAATSDVDKALAYLAEGAKYIDAVSTELKAVPTAAAVINLVVKLQTAITASQQAIERVKAPVPPATKGATLMRTAMAFC
jgi:hypothetical protein